MGGDFTLQLVPEVPTQSGADTCTHPTVQTDGKPCELDKPMTLEPQNVAQHSKRSQRTQNKTKGNDKVGVAKDYISYHNLEARLAEAMQAVLRERPENATEFLAARLLRYSPTYRTQEADSEE